MNDKTGKKGIVFTSDAIFALMIVTAVLPLIVLFSMENSSQTINQKLAMQSDDAINVISSLRVADVIREPAVQKLYANGKLSESDLNRSLIEFVGALWSSNSTENNTIAQNITSDVFRNFFPKNVDWGLSIENDTVYETSAGVRKTATSSRQITSGFRKGLPSAGYIASAYLTSIGGKNTSSYFFFGGFVGQGNLSVKISIPANASVTQIYLEANAGENFSLYVNNAYCASLNATPGNFSVDAWTITNPVCLNAVVKGTENAFEFNFTSGNITNEYVGGGFLKIVYSTADLLEDDDGLSYYRFPGINGILNLYDSFYVPGTVKNMTANITLLSPANYTTLFYVGNTTLINSSGTGAKTTIQINDSDFRQFLNYSSISDATVPIRMVVLANMSGGNMSAGTDVVLITDVSGSMAWRLDQDGVNGATNSNCNDSSIYLPNISRISLVKCLDKSFVNSILGSNNSACGTNAVAANNRVSLVSFSSSANSWENLTNNVSYLESKINAYSSVGSTCMSCAINRAYKILAAQTSANRTKYIVLMTDGEANVRSTPACYNMNGVSGNISVGDSGASVRRVPPWIQSNASTTEDIEGISAINNTFAKAAGSSGNIYSWNGTAWNLEQGMGIALYGINIFNRTLAFAVGAGGRIYKWNGAAWSQDAAFTGTIYSVKISSATLGFAVGSSGKIYRWNGAAWSQDADTGNNVHYGIAIVNSTRAFTASSDGDVYQWNGASWTGAPVSGYALTGVYAVNSTAAYAVGSQYGDVYEWNGAAWSRTFSKFYYHGNSTTGVDCGDNDVCSLSVSDSYSALNANYSAANAFANLKNLTIDTIGAGPIVSCTFGNQTLQEISKTGNGTAYTSANASQLEGIYCMIAQNILTKTTSTQQLTTQGALNASILYAESFIEFNYTSSVPAADYQEITMSSETSRFAGCDGSFILAPQIRVTNALRTSYSGFYWTKNMFLNNSVAENFRNIYNLTFYGKNYQNLGDPFRVYMPSALIAYNETNVVRNELGLNASYMNTSCSQYDRVIYTARLRASVPFGAIFPQLSGGVVRIYYDTNYDGVADGYTDLAIGADLPNFNPVIRTVDQLNPQTNALDDALMRLLSSLDFKIGAGLSGSQTNPIDVQLSNMEISTAGTGSVPYSWGPLDVKFEVHV